MNVLLTRDEFRSRCLSRDKNLCVVCQSPATEVHHIVERKLFTNPDEFGGYFESNGASLCNSCHRLAESTQISCDTLREAIGISAPVIPSHLYRDQEIDKWGNPVLANGSRLRGELFDDESVQKILAPVLHLFTNRVKYPRTHHLPWSPGLSSKNERIHPDLSFFDGKHVTITEKRDGENTTLYPDYMHARSIEYDSHPSRDRLKALHAQVQFDIPEGWRVCGENLYAKHAIHYQHLSSYFQVFSIWNEKNKCLSWFDTLEYSALLGLSTVPVIWQGVFSEDLIKSIDITRLNSLDPVEGYVVRLTEGFHYKEFRYAVAKYVRPNHVQSDQHHWKAQRVVPNLLSSKGDVKL